MKQSKRERWVERETETETETETELLLNPRAKHKVPEMPRS
jgi:hypothetical protein